MHELSATFSAGKALLSHGNVEMMGGSATLTGGGMGASLSIAEMLAQLETKIAHTAMADASG